MSSPRVAIVAGARTPFVKSGKAFASLSPAALANHAVRGLLERHHVDPDGDDVDWVVLGTHPLAGHYRTKAAFVAGTFAKLNRVPRTARGCTSSTFWSRTSRPWSNSDRAPRPGTACGSTTVIAGSSASETA